MRSPSASATAGAFVAVALLALGCATPVGVNRVAPGVVERQITASAIATGAPGVTSLQVLHRLGLFETWKDSPDDVLRQLHEGLGAGGDDDARLFALAELSHLRGRQTHDRRHHLASAVYAFALLFPGEGAPGPSAPWDPRVRAAYELYNRGIAEGFRDEVSDTVKLASGRRELPFGAIEIDLVPLPTWGGYRLDALVDTAELEVRGFANRYRHPGIGAPLAASLAAGEITGAPVFHHRLVPRMRIPVTAVLVVADPRRRLREGALSARVEVIARDTARSVIVQGREIPLEVDPTAALADSLEGAPVWDTELSGFFSASMQPIQQALRQSVGAARPPDGLFLLHPYRPGRIPVVLVHGTASSPARWAELVNELENDERVGDRYQIWLFTYNTGNPVLFSAGLMREALEATVRELDPDGNDPALRRMVVIGHSQGGLLTKLTAVDSGDVFWRRISGVPLEQIDTDDETRSVLRRSTFVKPVPGVQRVVFVATPFRGSYLALFAPARWIADLISLPASLSQSLLATVTRNEGVLHLTRLDRLPTSVDNMTPGNPFLRELLAIPIAPGIHAHSIIPVLGTGPLEEEKDGVVAWSSAHIEGVESEKVVRGSSHSTQSNPGTIEEIRRILIEHAATPPSAP